MNTILREINKSDLELLYKWANEKDVRENAICQDRISIETHKRWFKNRLNDNNTYIFVMEIDSIPVGQVRFEKNDGSFLVDYSIDKSFRNRGFGTKIIRHGIQLLTNLIGFEPIVKAIVAHANIGSLKVFEKIGFQKLEEIEKDGRNFFVYLWK